MTQTAGVPSISSVQYFSSLDSRLSSNYSIVFLSAAFLQLLYIAAALGSSWNTLLFATSVQNCIYCLYIYNSFYIYMPPSFHSIYFP